MTSPRIIFSGARLFDGVSAPRDGVSVVIEGKRISQITDSAVESREGDRVIFLAGKTLMPGMVQGHFHASFGPAGIGQPGPLLGLEAPATYMGILAARNVATLLDCGFTGAIGSSNADGLDVSIKDAIVNGVLDGPRYLACTREYMATGEQADGHNRSWFMDVGNKGLICPLSGPEAFRQEVRRELGRGCDVVKISVSRGHGSDSVVESLTMTLDEIQVVVDTAHERGRRVRSHCPSKVGILACAKAGVDIIDHADRLDSECIDAILTADVSVCPSMLWSSRFLQFADSWDHEAATFPIGEGFPEPQEKIMERLANVRKDYEHMCSVLPDASEAGVRLVTGDDFGFPMMPHGDYVSEFEVYTKEVGIAPIEVLRWATKNGADTMGNGDDTGTISEGKFADLLVVDGDPTEDVGVLRAGIQAVMIDGRFVREPSSS
jgi:imidazolonepropionase-like amidohydrolase